MEEDPLESCDGFDWDDGNINKNWIHHGVAFWECEEVFFNQPLVVQSDVTHSIHEDRYYVLGRTNSDRRLFIVFTIRENLIRVISARDMTRRERKIYEQNEKEDTSV